MAFGSIFKTQKHKRFEYRPVFYNPDKEEFEKRVKRAEYEAAKGDSKTEYIPNIKGKMKDYLITQDKIHSTHTNIKRIIIVITLGLLIVIFYYLVEITEFVLSLPGN